MREIQWYQIPDLELEDVVRGARKELDKEIVRYSDTKIDYTLTEERRAIDNLSYTYIASHSDYLKEYKRRKPILIIYTPNYKVFVNDHGFYMSYEGEKHEFQDEIQTERGKNAVARLASMTRLEMLGKIEQALASEEINMH